MLPLEPQYIVEEAKKCVLCGRCLSVCPTFIQTGREEDSPRGKLFLIANLFPLTKPAIELIFPCLLCGECEDACPMEIKIMDVLLSLRFYYTLPIQFEFKEIKNKDGSKVVFPGCYEEPPEDGMVPHGLACSGFYYLLSGNLDSYKRCAERNIHVLKGYKEIDVLCPLALISFSLYPLFFGEDFRLDVKGEKPDRIPRCFFNVFPERFQ